MTLSIRRTLGPLLSAGVGVLALSGCTAATQDPSERTDESSAAITFRPIAPIITPIHTFPLEPTAQTIAGTDLEILLNYEANGASAPQDVNVLSFPFVSIPAATQALLQTPLSTQFDTFWMTSPKVGTASPHDQFVAQVEADVTAQIKASIGSKYGPYGFDVAVPTSGTLTALLNGSSLTVTYDLGQVIVNFTSSSGYSGGLIPDPTFEITFDAAIVMDMTVPSTPCQLNVITSLGLTNANISPTNVTAQAGTAIAAFMNEINDQPSNVFQAAEGSIDGSYASPAAPLSSALSGMQASCTEAAGYGFTQFGAFINGSTLGFRLSHPVEAAPTVVLAGSGVPNLLSPTLGASQTPVTVVATDSITGQYFPVSAGTSLDLSWNDTLSNVTHTNIRWGLANGTQQLETFARSFGDQSQYAFTNLLPNAFYQFQVQDCDILTCSPYGNTLTALTGSGAVQLFFNTGSANPQVGTATLSSTGTFTTNITIPSVPEGTYALTAVVGGKTIATTELTVLTTNTPVLEFWSSYSNTGTQGNQTCGVVACELSVWGNPITLRGSGFLPAGAVTLSAATPSGPQTFSATADTTGGFTVTITPNGSGDFNDPIVAEQLSGRIQASVMVMYENPAK